MSKANTIQTLDDYLQVIDPASRKELVGDDKEPWVYDSEHIPHSHITTYEAHYKSDQDDGWSIGLDANNSTPDVIHFIHTKVMRQVHKDNQVLAKLPGGRGEENIEQIRKRLENHIQQYNQWVYKQKTQPTEEQYEKMPQVRWDESLISLPLVMLTINIISDILHLQQLNVLKQDAHNGCSLVKIQNKKHILDYVKHYNSQNLQAKKRMTKKELKEANKKLTKIHLTDRQSVL